MSFQWPYMFLAMLLLPILVALYVWLLRRRRRHAIAVSDVGLIRTARGAGPSWRRHIPPFLFLMAVASMLFGLTRPVVDVEVPLSRTSIILALDVSRSMCAVDIEPNRLTVAQAAATEFVEAQADSTQIGIVAFAGFAELVVPPTNDKVALTQAIDGFNTSFGTAMGSATMRSLDALAEINPEVTRPGIDLSETIDRDAVWGSEEKVPDIIVVLTDGANTQGVDPIFAAEQAADRRVRVYTIGFGTTSETTQVCNPQQAGADFIADPFGEVAAGDFGPAGDFGQIGGFGSISQFLVIDEPTLQTVAATTGGEYFRAEDAEQLVDIFLNLPTQIAVQTREAEATWVFALGAAAFVVAAVITGTTLGRRR
ncbi:MAG: VWA domain-containing protein [Actinomycetota bacterium]